LTAAAVLGIAFTPTRPHPPLKTDEKCRQKAELGFAEGLYAITLHIAQLCLPLS